MKSSVQFSPNKHLENITKMFRKLHNDEQLADVTLWCKDGTIKAHKIILATCSPYFHKIFTENNHDHLILIMHGISYQHLHDIIELIYKGNVDVLPEALNPLYDLAGEFQISGISGVLREEDDKSDTSSPQSRHSRETRYRGLKRVAVDFKNTEIKNEPLSPTKRPEKENSFEIPTSSDSISEKSVHMFCEEDKPVDDSMEISNTDYEVDDDPRDVEDMPPHDEVPKLSAWAKKQRKFKCDLCPSSFKRSSHLTRHQLVHTGERPFACEQCEKAFSRHDKLKHHVRKTHESNYEADLNYTMVSSPPSPPPFVISNVRTAAEDLLLHPPKRPRGRPRKYPVAPKPLVKRGRGRPRLTSSPREGANGENYDITNLPYGDLEYLIMPLQESTVMEPYVEIKTENQEEREKTEDKNVEEKSISPNSQLEVLENRIAKIGECTISVANHQ